MHHITRPGRELGVRLVVSRNLPLIFHTMARSVIIRAVLEVKTLRRVSVHPLRERMAELRSGGPIGHWVVESGGIVPPVDLNGEGLRYFSSIFRHEHVRWCVMC